MENNCPICNCENCDEFIIDLLICNNCSHIFKKEMTKREVCDLSKLHEVTDPIGVARSFLGEFPNTKTFKFEFPSMMFYTFEVHPNSFYKSTRDHYFNQISLMIFLARCGLVPTKQVNSWDGKICRTKLSVERERAE